MTKHLLSLFLILAFCPLLNAQTFEEKFDHFWNVNDTLYMRITLEEWQAAEPTNPELFTALFNYYFMKASHEVLVLSAEAAPTDQESLVIQDSLNNQVGSIYAQKAYQPGYITQGIDAINKGIVLYPNRLDMRFGKIYVYGQMEDWEAFTQTILETIETSKANDNKWLTSNNEPLKDAKQYMLSVIQDYQYQLYSTENDSLLKNMREIAEAIVTLYPDHVESWSNIGIIYILTGKLDKAIESYKKAESIDPTDVIVLANIAQIYEREGDKERAKEYYNKISEHGKDEDKRYAKVRREGEKAG